MDEREQERATMVESQLRVRGIRDERVLAAMRAVPRHLFVHSDLAKAAYADQALPIANEQTISQPYIVARMAEALQLRGSERVLEIGTGSGYAAAVLAKLVRAVYTVERHRSLAIEAIARLDQLAIANVWVATGDGSQGWPAYAPYDAITVAAASPSIPAALKAQLAAGGRLVIPVGERNEQRLYVLQRTPRGDQVVDLGPVRFVPLLGAEGWDETK